MTSVKKWIDDMIKDKYIDYFKYNEFSLIGEISRGGFGKVIKANSANNGLVALKIFVDKDSNVNEDKLSELNNEFVNELKLLCKTNHENVNRILGITKDPMYYILVLEYANEGNLKDYLKNNFTSLEWKDKIQMALDITCGLKCLHSNEIIHRDLHSKNILVNDGKLLIADLGLSKILEEAKTDSKANNMGIVEYIDPQCFKFEIFKKNKKSDIYSLGVLLWEISSGYPPFLNHNRELLHRFILDGCREKLIEGTPQEYQELYQKCWDRNPDSRPNIENIYEILSQLKTEQEELQKSNLEFDEHDDLYLSNHSKNMTSTPKLDYFDMVFIVIVGGLTSRKMLSKLNLNSNLSDIRKELECRNIMYISILFAEKLDGEFAKIDHEDEDDMLLNEIIFDNSGIKILYLLKNSSPSWNILNEKYRLDHGRIISFDGIKIASRRAFRMKDCEFNLIDAEKYKKGRLEFGSQEDWMEKTNLFFSTDINIQNFVGLELSIKNSKDINVKDEINSTYKYTEIGKASLKFSKENLKLTDNFIDDVRYAIDSKDTRNFLNIIEEYGQFVPTEIILGGRVYFKDVELSSESSANKSKKDSVKMSIGSSSANTVKLRYNDMLGLILNFGKNIIISELYRYLYALIYGGKMKFYEFLIYIGISNIGISEFDCIRGGSSDSKKKSKFYSFDHMRLLGGSHPDDENFDEKVWIESLKDDQTWDCIEYKNPISIFKLLPKNLYKEICKSIGKRILYTSIEEYYYYLYKPGKYLTVELSNIPIRILDIILNEEAECEIFAAVVDTDESSKNVFFSCQILRRTDKVPSIIIHGIQEEFQKRIYKLKIGIMVFGYDVDFTSTYSNTIVELKKNIYDSKKSMVLLLKDELMTTNTAFLGIPVLNDLNHLNSSVAIRHNFHQSDNKPNELNIDIFSYCTKPNHRVSLPKFTFNTIIIKNCTEAYNAFKPFKLKRTCDIQTPTKIMAVSFIDAISKIYSETYTVHGVLF